ncbi:CBM96 family carbohydrate-binding protein [Flagellimonas zhangzhouensis]|uniref:Carbohydrate-binding module family 96 domain-containing protein n=1 Tax=Flagellimonas zhangzhouensis TaxID=1073328 RepID=A0A1H2YR59_9FLAO|nr:DNRLRE domain-containing protein [Allomuricauda zhangzhouensis]SDR00169.1 hypothetical protein SAMN05216294_3086 [Allomuricauda zhangzhouensis]SDX07647.1 hypothetical protein SAMN04487892_3177 [Allomuricauda zhangzhouensis]
MKRNPTSTFMLSFIVSILLLFGSCQKDSDLFAEAILDEPDTIVDDTNGANDDENAEVVVSTENFNAVDDAYIQDGKGYDESIVRVEANVRTTYLKFDLSSIEGTITSAHLEFTTDSDQGYGQLEAYEGLGTDWTEEDLTLDNAPEMGALLGEMDSEYTAGAVQTMPLDSDLLTTSMTSIVLNIKSGNDISIASKESANNPGPKLVVEFTGKANGTTQGDTTTDDTNIVYDNVLTLNTLKAFPSAFGAAAEITGGRGGTIYEVTNLNDGGPGSFKEAFQASGKRIIIIKVEGLANKSGLGSTSGDVTIWGQFAPGQGITLNGGGWTMTGGGNVIIRHITAQNGYTDCTVNQNCFDAINFYGPEAGTGIYTDHCSLRYGADQTWGINLYNENIKTTLSYNLLAEAIPEHSTAVIFTNKLNPGENSGNHSFARNMTYNISHRFPNMEGFIGAYEVYNNYYVNWSARMSRGKGAITVDWHDNYAAAGNRSKSSVPVNKWTPSDREWNGNQPSIYSANNFIENIDENPDVNQEHLWTWFTDSSDVLSGVADVIIQDEQLPATLFSSFKQSNFEQPTDGFWSWDEIPQKMNASVGHNRGINADGSPGFFRDDLDADYLTRSLNGTTPSRYREPSEWTNSTFTNTEMYVDSDGDHMPDWFEARHAHLDPNDPSDMLKTNTNWNFDNYSVVNNAGYTNLEICAEYYAGGFEIMLDGTNDMSF